MPGRYTRHFQIHWRGQEANNENQVHEPHDEEPLAHDGSSWYCTKSQQTQGSQDEPCLLENESFLNSDTAQIMSQHRYLTKSRFKLAVECPTKLFYTGKPNIYRDTKQEDSFLQMLAEGGFQVGELAKCQFPEGVEVHEAEHQVALAKTALLLQQDQVVVFEAAIAFENFFIRVDVLVKDGNSYELIEVKAKSFDSTKPEIAGARVSIKKEMRPYIEDVAFQAWVMRHAYPDAQISTFLMMPDKSVKALQDRMNQLFKIVRDGRKVRVTRSAEASTISPQSDLLAKVPVDEFLDIVYKEGVGSNGVQQPLEQAAKEWARAYSDDKKIPPLPGGQCKNCEFKAGGGDELRSGFQECWSQAFGFTADDFAQGTVLELWNFRNKDELISQGRIRLSAVQPGDIDVKDGGDTLSLSERQWMQAKGIPQGEDRGGYWLAEAHMRREMATWRFPYHFIDFETSAVAIPFHQGMRPYEQVAFQYSHHVMHADGYVEHKGQFLMAEPGEFPNFEFARSLKAQLDGDTGTVFMWSHHENTILNRIMVQLDESMNSPDDADELKIFLGSLIKSGERAMYDLCDLAKAAYFHVDTKGSVSIKKVLPAMLASNAWLREQYARPIYGAADRMPSLNYKDFTWLTIDENGKSIDDPYEILRGLGAEMLGESLTAGQDPDELVIAEGGAAATAYSRLQFEDLQEAQRSQIKEALLRYCELDTLAMVMVVQGWQQEINH